MSVAQIKEELHQYIDKADTRLIKLMYALARGYTEDDFTKPGKPMSKETLINRIQSARSRIKSGRFTTQEGLETEIKS